MQKKYFVLKKFKTQEEKLRVNPIKNRVSLQKDLIIRKFPYVILLQLDHKILILMILHFTTILSNSQ